ncbi:hypothetical protein NHX12_010677 [Muraenolepis orangiensis]|uniref:Uncharacterized protein n=1 Tax=Muraenolepis orangiensis TaxID=630683 RepID=A0A9Q0DK95_9TELE|nr:hypothetical protein NHX12_010677 [Muraenolepis orangiensis]
MLPASTLPVSLSASTLPVSLSASTLPVSLSASTLPVSLPPSPLPVSLPPLPCPGQPMALVINGGQKAEGGAALNHSTEDPPLASSSTATTTTKADGAACIGDPSEWDAQARESLRWEGVLEEPLAEEERLEVYRARRRQRYLALRQGGSSPEAGWLQP